MKVLLVGGGGREHALAWKISQSALLTQLFIAPGNAGTSSFGTNIDITETDLEGLLHFVESQDVDLTIVGPEAPLAAGIVDRFSDNNRDIFGPKAGPARLESSKSFAKSLMRKWHIPTANSTLFHDHKQAATHLKQLTTYPTVIKADGLASGKGVYICRDEKEAYKAIKDLMVTRIFGDAGKLILIEEFLVGPEVSVFTFTDGTNISPIIAACDHKRIGEGDTGLNTGGMGAFSPPSFWSSSLENEITTEILKPIVRAMQTDVTPFIGTIFAGLMITAEGPKVVEFNCRLGDPETQVIIPLLQTDLLNVFKSCVHGNLGPKDVIWDDKASVSVVMASGGYPAKYNTGYEISGLHKIKDPVNIFHAGTRTNESGSVVTNGGRVLSVCATGSSIYETSDIVYQNIDKIDFKDKYVRRDIASR